MTERPTTVPTFAIEDASDALELTRDKLTRMSYLMQHLCTGFFERFADGETSPAIVAYAVPQFRAVALAVEDLLHDAESNLPSLEWLLESDPTEAAQDRAVKP